MGQSRAIHKFDKQGVTWSMLCGQMGAMPTRPHHHPAGSIAVIFTSRMTGADADGYAKAAAAMEALAAAQPGYLGHDSARGADGLGVTISYWTDEASARAWYRHSDHAAIRDAGRGRWYREFTVHVSEVTRSYAWARPDAAEDAG